MEPSTLLSNTLYGLVLRIQVGIDSVIMKSRETVTGWSGTGCSKLLNPCILCDLGIAWDIPTHSRELQGWFVFFLSICSLVHVEAAVWYLALD